MINHYDFNGDGKVDASDYVELQNLIGIRMNLPEEARNEKS